MLQHFIAEEQKRFDDISYHTDKCATKDSILAPCDCDLERFKVLTLEHDKRFIEKVIEMIQEINSKLAKEVDDPVSYMKVCRRLFDLESQLSAIKNTL